MNKKDESLEDQLRFEGWSEDSIESILKGNRQAERGETYHFLPKWKRIFNPWRKLLFKYRHRYGKWKNLNDS